MFFHLQISQLHLISTDACGSHVPALWTLRIVVAHDELTSTELTTMTAGTEFDPQFKRLQIGLVNDRFKTEAQCVLIDGCHFANPDTDFARIGSRMEDHLCSNRFQHRIRDSHLVHTLPSRCAVIDRLPACPRFGSCQTAFALSPAPRFLSVPCR